MSHITRIGIGIIGMDYRFGWIQMDWVGMDEARAKRVGVVL